MYKLSEKEEKILKKLIKEIKSQATQKVWHTSPIWYNIYIERERDIWKH